MCRPDAVTALDRPHPLAVLAPGEQHCCVAGLVRAEPSYRQHLTGLVDDLDRGRALVGSIPMITPIALSSFTPS